MKTRLFSLHSSASLCIALVLFLPACACHQSKEVHNARIIRKKHEATADRRFFYGSWREWLVVDNDCSDWRFFYGIGE